MLLIAVASGAAISVRPAARTADLTVWAFADAHVRTYRPLARQFEQRTGRSVRVDAVSNNALNMRLTSMLMSPGGAERPPDAVEIEIGSIGRYFRAPASDVGFLPLNDRLQNSGWREIPSLDSPGQMGWNARLATDVSRGRRVGSMNSVGADPPAPIYTHDGSRWVLNPARDRPDAWIDRVVRSRFAPWSKGGVIFGVPHDVHPVTITFRHDLFAEAGVDLAAAKTWPDFQEKCLAFQQYWRSRGYPNRHAVELPLASADNVVVMLLQRHVNLVDDFDRIHVAGPKVAQTLAFYAQLVAGPRRVGAESSGGKGAWAGDVAAGNFCAFVTPDWKMNDLKVYAPELAGKMRMMPLPVFDPGDARTSTWGGTMIGIPRQCKDPDAAWALIEHLYFSDDGLDRRRTESNILPPLMEHWADPEYHQPDPYFGGQRVEELYTDLAPEIPPRFVSPLTVAAQSALGYVLGRATDYVNEHGTDGLEAACQQWLQEADAELRRRLKHGKWND